MIFKIMLMGPFNEVSISSENPASTVTEKSSIIIVYFNIKIRNQKTYRVLNDNNRFIALQPL